MEYNRKRYLSPLQSLDFYLQNFDALCKKLRLENELAELKGVLHRDLDASTVEILRSNNYQALVVTDLKKTIIWVNKGFKEMTGYPKGYALGKRPTFLQGKNTSPQTKVEIRELLKQETRFSKAIVNYRKNGEEYLCHIDVLPLFNGNKVVTHFLAMEREQLAA